MKIDGQQINFIVINKQANSLYSLIADGQYRATSLGRDTWKELIGSQASLQSHCNREGFNAECSSESHSKARIGIISNGTITATAVTPESGLVLEESMMTATRVEMKQLTVKVETNTSKPWVIFWCSDMN